MVGRSEPAEVVAERVVLLRLVLVVQVVVPSKAGVVRLEHRIKGMLVVMV